MLENELTTVQITKKMNKLLGDISEYFNRSKSGQLEWWIKNEHQRIFQDGEREPAPAETVQAESQA